MKTTDNLTELSRAMFSNSIPCNAIPFLNGLIEGIKLNGSDYLKTDEAKKILWVINSLSYGQLSTIDMCNEFTNLM